MPFCSLMRTFFQWHGPLNIAEDVRPWGSRTFHFATFFRNEFFFSNFPIPKNMKKIAKIFILTKAII